MSHHQGIYCDSSPPYSFVSDKYTVVDSLKASYMD